LAAAEDKLDAQSPQLTSQSGKQDEDAEFESMPKEMSRKLTATKADVRMGSESDPICNSAGCTQYLHPRKDGHPMDYFVPNWGKYHDADATEKHTAAAEEQLGHKWNPEFDEETEKWIVPTESAEFKLTGTSADVRLNEKSDLACGSAGCTQDKHPSKESFPRNYLATNVGKAQDAASTESHTADAAEGARTQLGHTRAPKSDEESERWAAPTEGTGSKLTATKSEYKSDMNEGKGSDPSCSSSGWCGESLWPRKETAEKHKVLRTDTTAGANQAPPEPPSEESAAEITESSSTDDDKNHQTIE